MPATRRAARERTDEVPERIYVGRRFGHDTDRPEKPFAPCSKTTASDGVRGKNTDGRKAFSAP